MTEPASVQRTGAPGSVYVALLLGLAAVGAFAWPPLPVVIGVVGLAAALHARGVLRRSDVSTGSVPSLVGAILSVVGILTVAPWIVGLVILVTVPR
jgi:hypothetical protein